MTYAPAARAMNTLVENDTIARVWRRDVTVWTKDPAGADARSIANRLGWLDVPTGMQPEIARVQALADEVRRDGIRTVYLLGMGGSSLCAEVMGSVFGIADGFADLSVMDTTDEAAIVTVLDRLEPERTLFLVSSKSGGTIEPASMERLYWQRMARDLGDRAGPHFIAVTDPGTALADLAKARGYRHAALNPPDIGGRFSALSLFGLVPAALIGATVRDLLSGGADMALGCREQNDTNAGLQLGAFFGAAAREGRDKLTVLLPPSLRTLGLWIEQLVAESTGKHGTGALPVVDEPLGRPDEYGGDRAFVAIATESERLDEARLDALERAGHPMLRLSTRTTALGAEFFRWEFATAVAGAILSINPFDEPNVQEAKDKTRAILSQGTADRGTPAASADGVSVYSRFAGASPALVVRAAFESIRPRDYVAFLSYLSAESTTEETVMRIRLAIRARKRVASTFGVGPRYLHSTGQYHKGGPNTAVAFLITGEDATSTPIPDAPYTFAELKRAQAIGDAQALEAHDRRVVHIHLARGVDAASALERIFTEALA